jgi:hypothetical protein
MNLSVGAQRGMPRMWGHSAANAQQGLFDPGESIHFTPPPQHLHAEFQ